MQSSLNSVFLLQNFIYGLCELVCIRLPTPAVDAEISNLIKTKFGFAKSQLVTFAWGKPGLVLKPSKFVLSDEAGFSRHKFG